MEDDGEFDETWKAVAEEDKVEEAGEDEAVAATTKKDKAADVKKEKTIIKEEKASIIKTETNEEEEDTPVRGGVFPGVFFKTKITNLFPSLA